MSSDSPSVLPFLPVGLRVEGKHCLVVGGGAVGTRKALNLARAGANVTVISPSVTEELTEQIKSGGIRWIETPFEQRHLDGVFLAVAATDDPTLNAEVVRAAGQRGTLVCDASSAERSELTFGALLERDDATGALFTGGRDPARARRLRDRIAQLLAQDGEL